ncbi:MAG: ligase-associated DNA damage response endonuclease PdeM [Alphaproteobacteria bacterium]
MSTLTLAGATLLTDPTGALVWPDAGTLIVADLHLEKGSAYARHGTLLPPYDTRQTLGRLAEALERHRPRRVIALGDSFHDDRAAARLDATDQAGLTAMVAAHDWFWVAGNHDPAPPEGVGGTCVERLAIGALSFVHQAAEGGASGEISGHFHPKAMVSQRGRRVGGRCFVGDATRLILPAFGAYTGGLDVLDPAIDRLFPLGFVARILGRGRVHAVPRAALARA